MRPFPAIPSPPKAELSAVVKRGRYVAGTLAALGSFALLQAGDSAEAKTLPPSHPNSRSSSAHPPARNPSSNAPGVYTIKAGDNLWNLAARNRVTVAEIARANNISNADKIVAGEKLLIPSASAPPPPVAPVSISTRAKQQVTDLFAGPAPKATPGGPLPTELANSPQRQKLSATFQQAANEHNVPVDLLKALAWNESGWSNKMRSVTGAIGVGQLMPDTVDFVNESLIGKPLDPNRADHNIKMSAAFLRYLLNETHGDVRMALASYYQGKASVQRIGLLPDTKVYVKTVLALQQKYF